MDQITWMLGFLPNWFWNVTLIVSIIVLIVSWVLKFIPFVGTYRLPLQVFGVIASIVSVWFLGAASNEAKWQAQAEKYKNQITELENRQPAINTVVVEKLVKQKEYVKGSIGVITETIEKWNTQEIIKEVPVERVKVIREYIEKCPVPQEFIELHNKAATIKPSPEGAKK
jgi:hypothetical protein